jgi:hypothetical protein
MEFMPKEPILEEIFEPEIIPEANLINESQNY